MRWMIVLAVGLALALTACAESIGGGIDVIDVSGPLDFSALDFIADSIESGADIGQELTVVQLNSKAVLDGPALERLERLIESPPLPVAIWIGPAPATVYGAVTRLIDVASQAAIAPGSELGHFEPAILGEDEQRSDETISAEESGLDLQPTLRQYLQDLDGSVFETVDGQVVVATIRQVGDGEVTTKDVTFRQPAWATRFLRLAVTPEAAFFLLTVGLTIAAFEFYALGPGVAAGVASLALIPAGWGVLTLPVRWWAIGLVLLAFLILITAHQRGGIFPLTLIAAAVLQVAGMFVIDGGGQIDPRWWLILPSVLGVLFFFLIAMPTVQRARLSTETIGRDALIGESGVALVDFDPDGLVEVRGARWKATAHREAAITAGDEIEVGGVDGLYLEVVRLVTDRET